MTHRFLAVSLVLACLGVLAGTAAADPFDNGRYINGRYINGRYINGRYINGRYINGVALAATTVGGSAMSAPRWWGQPLSSVHLEGSRLVGWYGNWRIDDFTGVTMQGWIGENRQSVETVANLMVDHIELDPADSEIVHYYVSYYGTGLGWSCGYYGCWQVWQDGWWPVCDGPAIAIQGTWDYREGWRGAGGKESNDGITLACVDNAIGKCVAGGYKPWKSSWEIDGYEYRCWWDQDGEQYCGDEPIWRFNDMSAAHQACVRMLRADYCGDGISHTEDGTDIDAGDSFLPQVGTMGGSPSWGFEAVWSATGATCVANARFYTDGMVGQNGCVCTDNGACPTGQWDDLGRPSSTVPFSYGDCDIPPDRLYNVSSTVDPTSAPL